MAAEAPRLLSDHVDTTAARAGSASQSIEDNLHPPDTCVICLDQISDRATVLPCKHDHFHFACVGTWIQQQRVCPLCKSDVHAIKHISLRASVTGTYEIFHLPPPEPAEVVQHRHTRHHGGGNARYTPYGRGGGGGGGGGRAGYSRHRRQRSAETPNDTALDFRRQVYRNKTYSLHVGTNRISKYRNITPSTFQSTPQLDSRARIFIRRELCVFDFLNPDSASVAASSRRVSNAEFLLEYIVSILRSVDLKSSTGQAQALLAAFLGSENARLFLHELEAWLRCPYEKLSDWDRHVQYGRVEADRTRR